MPEHNNSTEDLEASYFKAKNAALRLLSYRSRSEKEVQRRAEIVHTLVSKKKLEIQKCIIMKKMQGK